MKETYAVCVGGANIDIHSRLLAPAVLRDSNPGTVSMSSGGVARNIAENIARLGLSCRLFTAVGKDAFGKHILEDCEKAGIDTRTVYISPSSSSSVYLDINDSDGDMFLASSDMRVLGELPEDWFQANRAALHDASAIVADGNLSENQLADLLENKGKTPLFADPVSAAKAGRFLPFLDRIDVFKPNRMELAALSGIPCETDADIVRAAKRLLDKGLGCAAVSLGAKGCYYADKKGRAFFAAPKKAEVPVSATGAGDAFMAGLVYAFVRGDGPEEAVRLALGCGAFTLLSRDTIHPEMSLGAVEGYLSRT